MNPPQPETANMLGIPFCQLDMPELVSEAASAVEKRQRKIIAYANVYALNLAYEQPRIHAFFARYADIVLCDGYGVKLGGILIGVNIRHRLTSFDWLYEFLELSMQKNYTLFLLGARPGVAERVAQHFGERFPDLKIVGTQHGYFNKQAGNAENQQVIEKINQARPDMVLVAFGMPLQEMWLMDNWEQINGTVAITVGGMFSYLGGEHKRPPRWMTQHGLEWFGRLFIEPRRLWRRYIIGNPLFFWRLFKYRLSIRPAHMQRDDS